eukprot:2385013-Alexandrium_andersonii.AAC.1
MSDGRCPLRLFGDRAAAPWPPLGRGRAPRLQEARGVPASARWVVDWRPMRSVLALPGGLR